jgi:hypothetical protein
MVSDAVCNILRGPLIKYTQDMCQYYDIALTPDIQSGPIWNLETEVWESALVPLPMTPKGKVILVPKVIVRHQLNYRFDQYYTHYLLPVMQADEMANRTSLVHLLKDKTPRVTKKSLKAKYGSDKLAVVRETLKRPHVLEAYKQATSEHTSPPLEHDQFAEIENSSLPEWGALIEQLKILPPGNDYAPKYEDLVERLLTSLFYPALCKPQKQHKIHDGRKRIDITYTNEAQRGFFYWLAMHYPAGLVFVECKNYGKEVGNPDLDQLAGRFSPSRGQVGLLVCRSVKDIAKVTKSCIDTAKDQRGYILLLTDGDIRSLAEDVKQSTRAHEFPTLRAKFTKLIT